MDERAAVLVVDGEPGALYLAARSLSARRLRVALASSIEEALEAARRERPAALVLDVDLRRVDGGSALEALQDEAGLLVPFVLLVRRASRAAARESLARGAVAILERPVPPGDLVKAVEKAVAAGRRANGRSFVGRRIPNAPDPA